MLITDKNATETGMARLILIICAIGAVALLLRRVLTDKARSVKRDEQPAFAATARCTRCGAYVDRRLMRPDGDGFCCQEHDTDRS
ncbi:hypothetical protein V5738_13630 [Salinisphaera sp. SPP-AMP-43]|uniref:hypothetical protein n=1 Tax=Salinisphaera sp. SPP-AMP-43 TaxID=3121288 RepID=UPI003C6E7C07